MNAAVTILLLAALLLLPGVPARAAAREFGPDALRLALDVPDGWTAQESSEGAKLRLVAPGGDAAISLCVGAHEGKEAVALLRRVIRDLSGQAVRRIDASAWSFDILSENVRVRNQLRVYGAFYVVVSMAGNEAVVDPVVASLKPAAR